MYQVILSRQAQRDRELLKRAKLADKAKALLIVLMDDPYQDVPRYEKLRGELAGCYSRRINIQHRLVYTVDEDQKVVHVLRMWTHYE